MVNFMKRTILIAITSLMMLCVSASAATIEPWGALEDDVVRISGEGDNGKNVNILVINPGYDEEDVLYDGSMAIQFYGRSEVKDGKFVFDIPMYDANSDEGGEYSYVITSGTSSERGTFSFYFYEAKNNIIEEINESEDVTDIVDKIYAIYSLNSSDIFKTTSKSTISKFIKKTDNYPIDSDKMKTELEKALCISAYFEGNPQIANDGYLSYGDIIGIEGTDLYEDYKILLSDSGRTLVNSKVLNAGYDELSEIKEGFEDCVLLTLITHHKDEGYGHVSEILNKYKPAYDEAGVSIKKITATGREYDIFRMMANSSAESLTDLKKEIDSAIKKYSKTESGGSGGGGGGGSSSGGSLSTGGTAISDPVTSDDGYVERNDSPFTDIESVSWANESIGILYNRGIISGKSKTEFCPNDNITRAEFTKLVVAAFFAVPNGKTTKFTDVSGWSVPYVAYASDNGIVNGMTENLFNPDGDISREQAMTILARALDKKGYEGNMQTKAFADDSQISEWAKNAVYTLADGGVISGKGSNMFCPKDNLTRAEAAKIIHYSMKLTKEAD